MHKQITVNGTNFAYYDYGQGNPVVLLHGFCGSSAYWNNVVPSLQNNYRILVPDLRGHGQSGQTTQTHTMELFAEDIHDLLQAINVQKATLIGHSLGGYITLAFAEKYASRLHAFGLVHSTAYPDTEQAKENRLAGIATIQAEGLKSYIERLIPKLFAPSSLTTMPQLVQEAMQIGYDTNPVGAQATLEGMRQRPDRRHVLSNTKIPILLVAGSQDQVISPERTFCIQDDHIRHQLFEHTGHMSMYEDPELLTSTLDQFLQTVYS